ncbi:MAG: DUF1616 domain-containing protein [Chloroflexota bacterium]
MFRKYVDLIAYMITMVVAVVVLRQELPLQPVMGILLVFILPGYAMQSLIYDEPGEFARLLLTIGISTTITILVGFLIHLSPYPITRESWLVSLGVLSTLLGFAAAVRRAFGNYPFIKTGRLTSLLASNLVVPVIGVCVLLFISYQFAISQPEVPFTSFSILSDDSGGLRVNVNNFEQMTVEYNIEVKSEDGQVIYRESTGPLTHTSSKTYVFEPPTFVESERITAELYRDGDLYRRAWVDF